MNITENDINEEYVLFCDHTIDHKKIRYDKIRYHCRERTDDIILFDFVIRERNNKKHIYDITNRYSLCEIRRHRPFIVVHKNMANAITRTSEDWQISFLVNSVINKLSIKNVHDVCYSGMIDFQYGNWYDDHIRIIVPGCHELGKGDKNIRRLAYSECSFDHSVDIVIVSSNENLLNKCLISLEEIEYKNYKVTIGWYGNKTPEIKTRLINPFIKILDTNKRFNYSAINNYLVDNFCNSEYVVLCNDDIIFLNPQWLNNMISLQRYECASIVGSSLYYPNSFSEDIWTKGLTYQHAGIEILDKFPYFSHRFSRKSVKSNYLPNYQANMVTFALVLMKTAYLKEYKLNPEYYGDTNDIDMCFSACQRGDKVWYCSGVDAIHLESATRKDDESMKGDFSSHHFYKENKKELAKLI